MPAQWTAEIVGKLHAHKVTQGQLAACLQVTPEYVSMVLNGSRRPKNAQERFTAAVEELIAQKLSTPQE